MNRTSFKAFVELEVDVEAEVSRPSRGARDRYGVQLEPDDRGGDVSFSEVRIGGVLVDPNSVMIDGVTLAAFLADQAREEAADEDASAADDRADRLRDERAEA